MDNYEKNKKKFKIVLLVSFLLFVFWQILYTNYYKNRLTEGANRQFSFQHDTELDHELSKVIESEFMKTISHVSYIAKKEDDIYRSYYYRGTTEFKLIKLASPLELFFEEGTFKKRLWTKNQKVEYLDVLKVVPIQKKESGDILTNYILTVDREDIASVRKNKKKILAGEVIVRPKNFENTNEKNLESSNFYTYQKNPKKNNSPYTFLYVNKERKREMSSLFDYEFNYRFLYYAEKGILKGNTGHDNSFFWKYSKKKIIGDAENSSLDISKEIKKVFFGKNQENFFVQTKNIDKLEINQNFVKDEKQIDEGYARLSKYTCISPVNSSVTSDVFKDDFDDIVKSTPSLSDYNFNYIGHLIEINHRSYLTLSIYNRYLTNIPYIENNIKVYFDLETKKIKTSNELGFVEEKKYDDSQWLSKEFSYEKLRRYTNFNDKNFLKGVHLESLENQGMVVKVDKMYYNELAYSKLVKMYPEIQDVLNQTNEFSVAFYFQKENKESIIPLLVGEERDIFQELVAVEADEVVKPEIKIASEADFETFYNKILGDSRQSEKVLNNQLEKYSTEYQKITQEIQEVLDSYMNQVYLQKADELEKTDISNNLKEIQKTKQKYLMKELEPKLGKFEFSEKETGDFIDQFLKKRGEISEIEITNIEVSKNPIEAHVTFQLGLIQIEDIFKGIEEEFIAYDKEISKELEPYPIEYKEAINQKIKELLNTSLLEINTLNYSEKKIVLIKKKDTWYIKGGF